MRSSVGMLLLVLASAAGGAQEVRLYTRPGCARCEDAAEFLQQLKREQPDLQVVTFDVAHDAAARAELEALVRQAGLHAAAVPAFAVGGSVLVGFSRDEASRRRVRSLLAGEVPEPGAGGTCSLAQPTCPPDDLQVVELPLLGRVDARSLGLPLFTVVIGLIDGFNPCAMWVLLFLLSLLVNVKSRARMFLIGGMFVLISGLAYYAFMAAWLNIFLLIGLTRAVEIALGVVGLVAAAINLKDALRPGTGPSLSIPESAKPGISARVRRIVQAQRVGAALAGAAVLAVLVNALELLCSAGLPALYTQLLAHHQMPRWQYHAYLALYDTAYMLDDTLMLLIAVATLSRYKLQQRAGRWLKLLSGVVMGVLAVLLLVAPGWLR